MGVEDYDEAIELLEKIGCKRRSRQETLRTKYVFGFNHATFYLIIDRWPWLDEVRFVSLEPRVGVDAATLDDVAQWLKLGEHLEYEGGVDSAYQEKFGFRVSDVPEVRFGMAAPV